MFMRSYCLIAAVAFGIVSTGCAGPRFPTQAPFDSFVCFNSSFADCASRSQSGQLKKLGERADESRTGLNKIQHEQMAVFQQGLSLPAAAAHKKPHGVSAAGAPSAAKPVAAIANGNGHPTRQVSPGETSQVIPPVIVLDGVLVNDLEKSAPPRVTGDKKQSCKYVAIPYTQEIVPTRITSAVFVSPVLIRQLGEELIAVEQSRLACDRLVEAYDAQTLTFSEHEKLAEYQRGVSELTAWVERRRIGKEFCDAAKKTTFENCDIDDDDVVSYGLEKKTNAADALDISRENVIDENDKLRALSIDQTLSQDFGLRFVDMQIAMDLRARAVARTLFLIDRSVVGTSLDGVKADYADGAWVKQGTVVLTSKNSHL